MSTPSIFLQNSNRSQQVERLEARVHSNLFTLEQLQQQGAKNTRYYQELLREFSANWLALQAVRTTARFLPDVL